VQALLEMSDLESAEAMVQYYSERPPRLGSHAMIVRFSNYEELKTEPTAQVYTAICTLVCTVFITHFCVQLSS